MKKILHVVLRSLALGYILLNGAVCTRRLFSEERYNIGYYLAITLVLAVLWYRVRRAVPPAWKDLTDYVAAGLWAGTAVLLSQ